MKNKNLGHRSIRQQVEAMTRRKLASQDIVDLSDFRSMRKATYQPTVLIVDDEEMMRNALKRIMETEGYKVLLAEDALSLTKVLDVSPLDCILLDINLPWVDGLELCSLFKGHPSLSMVPLVLISGRKTKEDIERGFDAGCDDYVTKPFEVERIVDVVSKALTTRQAAQEER